MIHHDFLNSSGDRIISSHEKVNVIFVIIRPNIDMDTDSYPTLSYLQIVFILK